MYDGWTLAAKFEITGSTVGERKALEQKEFEHASAKLLLRYDDVSWIARTGSKAHEEISRIQRTAYLSGGRKKFRFLKVIWRLNILMSGLKQILVDPSAISMCTAIVVSWVRS